MRANELRLGSIPRLQASRFASPHVGLYIWWTSMAQPREELYIAQQSAHSSSENEAAEETHDTDIEPGSAIGVMRSIQLLITF